MAAEHREGGHGAEAPPAEEERILGFRDLNDVTFFLRRFLYDPEAMRSMRAALVEAGTIGVLYYLDDERVIHHVGLLILAGSLRISTRDKEPRFPVRWKEKEEPAPTPTPPKEKDPEKDWIEIALLDEDGDPIPDEPYWIELPNKKIVEGKLDKKGRAKVKDIDSGECKVRFPKLEGGKAKKGAGQDKQHEPTWIDIHLTDDEGHPVPEACYRVELADSSRIEGKLDKEGKAHIEGIDPGSCHVTFPDMEEWKHHSSG